MQALWMHMQGPGPVHHNSRMPSCPPPDGTEVEHAHAHAPMHPSVRAAK